MTDWTETYRGAVPPWQCDVTEHFTIAYYFDRLEEAAAANGDYNTAQERDATLGEIRAARAIMTERR